jgi:putative phosphoesterase
MSRIGVIGDTHGRVPERVFELFAGVERIIHTGDVGGGAVLDALHTIAPVTAVAGNYDREPELRARLLPDPSALVLAGYSTFLTHRLITLEWTTHRELIADLLVSKGFPPRLFIFGHTHSPVLEHIRGIWFVNPGYAGPDPCEGPATAIVLELGTQEIKGRIVSLEPVSAD